MFLGVPSRVLREVSLGSGQRMPDGVPSAVVPHGSNALFTPVRPCCRPMPGSEAGAGLSASPRRCVRDQLRVMLRVVSRRVERIRLAPARRLQEDREARLVESLSGRFVSQCMPTIRSMRSTPSRPGPHTAIRGASPFQRCIRGLQTGNRPHPDLTTEVVELRNAALTSTDDVGGARSSTDCPRCSCRT